MAGRDSEDDEDEYKIAESGDCVPITDELNKRACVVEALEWEAEGEELGSRNELSGLGMRVTGLDEARFAGIGTD